MANWVLYDNFRKGSIAGNACNLAAAGDTVKCALITSAVAPSTASDTTFSGAGYTEVSGTNYTAGGLTVSTGQSVTLAGGTVTWLTSTAFLWSQSGAGFSNARYAVLYDSTNGRLIAYADLGSNVGNVAGDLSFTGPATSIFTSP